MKTYNIDDFLNNTYSLAKEVTLENVYKIKDLILISNRVFLIGNGGSAAICDHIANDLMKRCGKEAFTLSSPALMTCLANDYGFDNIFSNFLELHKITYYNEYRLNSDLLIAISSSGKSKDIVNAIDTAKVAGANIIGMAGFGGFPELQKQYLAVDIYFDSKNYGEVEMATELVLHGVVEDIVYERQTR